MKRWIYVFIFLFLMSFVFAENNGCCPLTNAGDSCIYTPESNCAEDFIPGVLCENTDVCRTGCCVSAEGCFEGTGDYTCSLWSGDFFYDQECSTLESCQMTCCKFGSDYSFMNNGECQALIDEYGSDIVQSFSVADEAACEELEDQEDKGCCVTSSECSYITQAECGTSSYDAEGFGFFENEYCDSVSSYLIENNYGASDYCSCEITGNVCDDDKMNIVQMDSCGNYGEVVQECDFPDEMCITNSDGVAECSAGSCYFDLPSDLDKYNPLWLNDFRNYESRCLYEGPAGNYQDRPGSRHYVVRCVTGELILEQCEEKRTTVCVENYEDGFDWASCIPNNVDSIDEEVTTVPLGDNFWEYSNSGEVSDSCSEAIVSCDAIFGKGCEGCPDVDFRRECDANCFCLRKEWSMLMAEYCNARGDCGNDVNLLGKFSDGNFEIHRSATTVGGGGWAYATEIGCGDGCVDESVTANDARGVQCYPADGECNFYNWNKIKKSYRNSLNLRGTGGNYLFTLLDYVGINPGFLRLATSFGDSSEPYKYSDGIDILEISSGALDLTEEIIYHYYGFEADESNDVFSSIGDNGNKDNADTWIESINYNRNRNGFEAFDFEGDISLVGSPFRMNSVTEHLAEAPEYYFKDQTEFIPITISSTCGSWIAPETNDCELCDVGRSEGGVAIERPDGEIFDQYICNEYRCKSLGRNCEYITENEKTERSTCIYVEEPDSDFPIISLWEEKVDELGYDYTKLEDGVEVYEAPVGMIQMPVLTNEYAQCKISDDPNNFDLLSTGISFDEFFSALNSISQEPLLGFGLEHNFTYVLTEGGKEYKFWIYCVDYSNNPTLTPYEFHVFTTTLPDTDEPEIEGINPNSASYVKADETQVDLTVYLNENGYCKYSTQDISYEQMTSEFLSCMESDGIFNYVCITIVPLSAGTTSLYIQCSDVAGNVMSESEHWYISQSLPLLIVQTSPTGILYTNEIVLQVKTEDGADNDNAVCYYEGSGTSKQEMFVTGGSYHEQSLNLEKGSYSYTVTCEDTLGNTASSVINFVVDKDVSPAEIIGVYYLGTNVYVLTNEATSCQYKTESFSYGNGYDMSGVASTAHSFTASDLTQTYYINCIDAYANKLEGVKINLGYLL